MRKTSWFVILVGLLALGASLHLSRTSFERLPHLEDEYAYTYQAKIFAHGDVYIETPQPRRAFWQPFLIDLEGKRFGKYPPGWPLLLSFGYIADFPAVINAWFAMLAVLVTYRLGREIFTETTGVVAAILLATSPIALLQNATLMPHPATLFFTMLFLYCIWRLDNHCSYGSMPSSKVREHKRMPGWAMVAGFSLGMLIAIRPLIAVSVGGPLIAYSGILLFVTLVPEQWRVNIPVWWARVLRYWLSISGLTVIAYWVADQLTFWPNWPVLAIGATLAIVSLIAAVFELDQTRVNPAWPHSFWLTLKPLLAVAVVTVMVGAMWPLYNETVTGDPATDLYAMIWEYDTIGIGPKHGRYGHTWDKAKANLYHDMQCYSRDLFGWVTQPDNPPDTLIRPSTNDARGNLCVTDQAGLSWILLPVGLLFGWRRRWTYVLMAVAVAIVFSTMFYWIGAAVYSARYYYEATGILAIVSAVGISGIAGWLRKLKIETAVFAVLGAVIIMTLAGYVPRRLEPIEREYTAVARQQLANMSIWRQHPDQPLLVIVYGDVHWREINALMALTSPYLDSDVVLARDPERRFVFDLEAMFPEREVIYYKDGQFVPSPFG